MFPKCSDYLINLSNVPLDQLVGNIREQNVSDYIPESFRMLRKIRFKLQNCLYFVAYIIKLPIHTKLYSP